MKKVVNISYQFFSKENQFFPKIQGNGGARGASHIVILSNPFRPKSDLNEISKVYQLERT